MMNGKKMNRPITLCTAQWEDLPLKGVARKASDWGYDGLELACRGDHLDVDRAAVDIDYCKVQLKILADNKLKVFALNNGIAGQLVCDPNNDSRTGPFVPPQCHGDPEKKRAWAVETMKNTALAAKNMGAKVVNGFTGSSIWHLVYGFPPVSEEMIENGFAYFALLWGPILDVFKQCDVKFALEVHPTEIAFDIITAKKTIQAVDGHPAFGFNFDPSHLYWQMINPVCLLKEFPDRIFHVHLKDAALQLDGTTGILASHLKFGHPDRGWDFRSLGRGKIDFEEIIRTLNQINYKGPLSVEWEDSGMDREEGAAEACAYAKKLDFKPSQTSFESHFA